MTSASELLRAIAAGRTDRVYDWIAAGGSGADRDAHGTPLVAWCAHHGDTSALRHLLDHGGALADLGPNRDLNGAAFHGHWQLCAFLLGNGADANRALPDTGETPLHAALCKANRPLFDHVVDVLLGAGADPNRACAVGVPTGAFMRDCRTRGETPLHRAAAFGTERALELLLAAGADRELRDAHGDSPLAWASWHLRPPPILRLLAFGEHRIHPGNPSTYDHGHGWATTDAHLRGGPREA